MDKIDLSSTTPWSIQRIRTWTPVQKLLFFVFRHPLVFFTVTHLILWTLVALSAGMGVHWVPLPLIALVYQHGLQEGLMRWLLAYLTTLLVGFLFFHVQHVFDPGYMAPGETYTAQEHAWFGSTRLSIPSWLMWMTLGIEYHHIHHWSTRVPGYRMEACHRELEAHTGLLDGVCQPSWTEVASALWYTAWDHDQGRFVAHSWASLWTSEPDASVTPSS
jgi:omega-6 fatty acid desaturase (delta-12 desaturase)